MYSVASRKQKQHNSEAHGITACHFIWFMWHLFTSKKKKKGGKKKDSAYRHLQFCALGLYYLHEIKPESCKTWIFLKPDIQGSKSPSLPHCNPPLPMDFTLFGSLFKHIEVYQVVLTNE